MSPHLNLIFASLGHFTTGKPGWDMRARSITVRALTLTLTFASPAFSGGPLPPENRTFPSPKIYPQRCMFACVRELVYKFQFLTLYAVANIQFSFVIQPRGRTDKRELSWLLLIVTKRTLSMKSCYRQNFNALLLKFVISLELLNK